MNNKESIFNDKGFVLGLILIPVSFLIHLYLANFLVTNQSLLFDDSGVGFINFIIAMIYLLGILSKGLFKKWMHVSAYTYRPFVLAIVLFSISCFSINLFMPIFSPFTSWVLVYLFAMHLALIGLCFIEYLPYPARIINYFLLGLGAIGSLYFAVYLAPIMGIAFLSLILFGLGLNLFIPALMFIMIIYQFVKKRNSPLEKISFFMGILLPIIVVAMYTIKWKEAHQLVHKTEASIITRPDNKLPSWVLISQELDDDFFTERLLKSNIVYTDAMFSEFRLTGSNSISEIHQHDPLVVLGTFLMGDIDISREDRIKILESKFDLRHHTKRKLWTGRHLSTTRILTNIQVFPEYRLAYTEKIITIKNNYKHRTRRQEEALYTFHLPEGSVASSLSLWIDGVEEKSRLTTKHKAEKAYTNIVGVERRDPSILHWQEGNTITVYVFPCTPKEDRMFKIGITSPLKLQADKLVLENIYFEGPPAEDALETCVVEFKSAKEVDVIIPAGFLTIAPNKYQYDGDYEPSWRVICDAPALSGKHFSFQNKSYHMAEATPKLESVQLENVYLDINESWTWSAFNHLWKAIEDKNVMVYHDGLQVMTSVNKDRIFSTLQNHHFSLFPIDVIEDASHSLLITQSTSGSPMLKDLKHTEFVTGLKEYLANHSERINVFNLSDNLNVYLRTLKEFQIFNYTQGNMDELQSFIQNNNFIKDEQEENRVQLSVSNTLIIRDSVATKSEAPDHIMRLFAYNKIMKDCGRSYFVSEDYIENDLADMANEAFIVSPLSSLIVLESVKDYDRFEIGKNKDSLRNASANSSGSVPEPHEWAMIILLFSTLIFLHARNRKKTDLLKLQG